IMDKTLTKQIPYGIADYECIRSENYYYVDKTSFLSELEELGTYLVFNRPRRFGKSLLLNMMASYYDILNKDRFEELFKGTAVYDNPTERQGKYLVLSLNFSRVDAHPDKIEASFLKHVRSKALSFLKKYKDYLSKNLDFVRRQIRESQSAPDIFSHVMSVCKDSTAHVYLLIDEYDNFANTLLTTSGEASDHAMTHGEGTLSSFFKMIKGATTENNAPLERLFITGVSPITMDDVTSGFNIGTNVSLYAGLNTLVGFTREETEALVTYYRDRGLIAHAVADLMEIFDFWYGNYLFSDYAHDRLYNSDMLLYFLREYMWKNGIPANLIDRNVRVDYGKLRHLIILDGQEKRLPTVNGNFSKLKQIMEDGETSTQLVSGFSVDKLTHPENFKSLLFYLGLLTLKGVDLGEAILEIPNETVRRLYYDYFKEAYEETGMFALDLSEYPGLMKGLAVRGEWEPLFRYLTAKMADSINLRDLMTAEKAIQTFLNVYLGLSNLYIVHSEKEMNMGFSDLVMEPFLALYKTIKYSYLLEIKYLKAGAKPEDDAVKRLAAEAREQLADYGMDKKFRKTIGNTTLIKLVLVFSGHKVMYMGEV
ncbi:MAG: AAA family ATPase, partial [bacterium]|nr:AAA family ATPase [bacterium]